MPQGKKQLLPNRELFLYNLSINEPEPNAFLHFNDPYILQHDVY